MDVHGMEKCSRAMQERNERQGQGSLLIEPTAKLSREAPFQEFKRRHVLFAGEGDGPIFGDQAIVVGMSRKEIENAAANLRGSARGLDGREEIQARAAAQERKKVVLVGEALIESRGSGARGARDGAHGEGLLAVFAPDVVRGIKDAAFETSISFARHAAAIPLSIARDSSLYIVKFTTYK